MSAPNVGWSPLANSTRRGTSKIDPGSVLDNRGENNDDNADKHVEGSDSDTNGSMVVAKDNVEALEEKDDDTDVEYHGFDDLDYATNALKLFKFEVRFGFLDQCIIVNEGNLGIANWVVAFSFERREKGSGTSVRVCKALSLSIRVCMVFSMVLGFVRVGEKEKIENRLAMVLEEKYLLNGFGWSESKDAAYDDVMKDFPLELSDIFNFTEWKCKIDGICGMFHAKVNKDTKCLVVGGSLNYEAEVRKARRMKIPIVREDYLIDGLARKKRLPFDMYKVEMIGEASSMALSLSSRIPSYRFNFFIATLREMRELAPQLLEGQGYFDLNIPYPEPSPANKAIEQGNRTGLAVKAMELGYIGIAYNRMIKGIMSDHHRCSISPLILSSFLNVLPSLSLSANLHHHLLHVPLSTPFRQYTRLTVCVDSASQAQALNLGNPILKTYDLVIVKPLNQIAFDLACERMEDDIVSIDFSAVYHMPTTENDMPSRSIPLALQILFYKLQYSDTSVATKEFTKSFGWDTYDSFMQHDVQELNRVLYEKLEDKMKGTVVEGTIHKLFEGNHMNYIECINVDYKTTRKKSFYDLQLDVNGCPDVYASFDKFN
ncbi:hypothetical protein JHK86_028044 [Glycine max]|nr:hypothetical protein JHK86_028044 [Glycine max]